MNTTITICDWILENQPNCHSRPISIYWLMHLINLHYLFTVSLPGLADWLLFYSEFFRPCEVTIEAMGPMEGSTWKA